MAARQEGISSEGEAADDMYPQKILKYTEGFLVSKVKILLFLIEPLILCFDLIMMWL